MKMVHGNAVFIREEAKLVRNTHRYTFSTQNNYWEVEGCRSSMVRALVVKASGPGFNPGDNQDFFTFFLCFFFQIPLGEKVSI